MNAFKKSVQWIIVMLMLTGLVNLITVAAQTNEWETVRDQIFHLAEVVVHNALQENISEEEMRRVRFELKQLDSQFYAASKHCPSAKECNSLKEILQKTTHLAKRIPVEAFSPEENKTIAMLRQAVHNYRSAQKRQQQSNSAPPPPARKIQSLPPKKETVPPKKETAPSPKKKVATFPQTSQQQSPKLTLLYIYRALGQGKFLRLTDQGSMQSGDHYKIFFEVPESAYVYIFQADSSGEIFGLFPLSDFRGEKVENLSNPAKPGTKYFIPAQDKSFVLDQQVGMEQFYFLMLPERDIELERQYEIVLKAQNAKNPKELQVAQTTFMKSLLQKGPLHIAPDQMGQTTPTKQTSQTAQATQTSHTSQEENTISWQEAEETFSILRQRLTGDCKECINVLTFTHE